MKINRCTRNGVICLITLAFILKAQAQSADSSRFFYLKALNEKSNRLNLVAYNDFQRSLQYDSTNPDVLRETGLSAVTLRKYENAIVVFERLLRIQQNDTTGINQLAILYFWTQKWDKAVHYASRALQLHTGSNNYYMLGKSYYEMEDYGHAFSYLPTAAAEDPKNAEIPYLIARAYVDMSNYKPAIPYFQKAIALDSSKVQWLYECALVYATIYDDVSAIKYYDIAAARGYKKDNDFYENLADSYIAAGQAAKGLQILQDLVAKKPADLELLNSLGFTSYKLKKYDEAIEYWDRILSYDKQNGRALYMIGMAYQKKGDTQKGKELCDKAIALDPSLKNLKTEIRLEQ
ncbi:MAG: tetratricopeptide repeat protein [Bacteroidota bacterium]|nr:tetratricopeptide repeat protein [Bacteroidota bacterium]MDP4213662.1 tetratricopeptide repeat protein [Bacteroidota bacterium]MDP4250667.1 tetratricopeptide repeat protein [Bacteroidota bacterium]